MVKMKYKFYDTSSLLYETNLFEEDSIILVSSITLKELENIKVSNNKDFKIKQLSGKLLHILDNNIDKYKCCIYTEKILEPIK